MARRIIRTSGYTRPSRTVVRRKDGKLTARQKWLNSLGKDGMFEWEVAIKYEDGRLVQKTDENGITRTKTMKFDSIDDARAWAYNKCQPGWTIFVDGEEVVSR